ncbi:MAG TPA: hypothetical protein VGM84_16845 [Steroidobacteraceae bacterium]
MPSEEDLRRAEQFGKLTATVGHIQVDVVGIKERLDKVDSKIDALKESLSSAKVWALTLYFALAGSMLFVMAKGFKWI